MKSICFLLTIAGFTWAHSKTCLRGGLESAKCIANCPPCWKKAGSNFHCFEYNSEGTCSFDWSDINKDNDLDLSSAPSSSSSSSSTNSDKNQTKSSSSSKSTEHNDSDTEVTPDTIHIKPKNRVNQESPTTSTVTKIVKRSQSLSPSANPDDSNASLPIPPITTTLLLITTTSLLLSLSS